MKSDLFLYSLSYIAPLLTGLIIFLVRGNLKISSSLSVLSIVIATLSTYKGWYQINEEGLKFLRIGEMLYIDGFSIFTQFMVEFVSLFVILYSLKDIPLLYSHRKDKFHTYFSAILLSAGFMNLAFVFDNLFLVYIALELSSIISVYLITFNLNKDSLKAGFKYLLIVNVGILFSLLGIVLVSYNTGTDVLISNIGENVGLLTKNIALLCAGLFIIGFFTKAGLVPFHIWLPEAYAEAPTAITVFMAGALTKIGFYGLGRTVTFFAFNLEEIKLAVIILSSLSMLLGAILAFNQKDIKKLIAYCSISEMGFISSALVLSSYAGVFGAIFHLLNHTLMKGVLFFSAGILICLFGSRQIGEIKNSRSKKPLLVLSFLIGALAVGGMPPFSSFLSSLSIIFALSEEKFLWTAVIMAFSGFISTIALLRCCNSIFWEKGDKEEIKNGKSIPTPLILCSFLFALLLIIFGIYPEILYSLINSAAKGIINTNN